MAQRSSRTVRNVLAREIMTVPVLTVRRNATVSEAAALMLVNRMGSVVVVDDNGDYFGLLTERMLLPEEELVPFMRGTTMKLLGHEIGSFERLEETMAEVRSKPVSAIASKNPTASLDTEIYEITEMMVRDSLHHVTVLDDNKPVGMVSRHDLLRLFLNPAGDPHRG